MKPAQGKSVLDGMWKASPTRGHSFYGETLDPQYKKALCKARHNQALPGVLRKGQSTVVLCLLLASVPGTQLRRLPRPLSSGWRRKWRFRGDQEFFSAEEASLEFAPTSLHLIPNFRLAICLPETL